MLDKGWEARKPGDWEVERLRGWESEILLLVAASQLLIFITCWIMNLLKQTLAIAVLALIIGFSVNFLRSDSLPIFVSQNSGLNQSGQIEQISIEQARAALKTGKAFFLDLRSAEAFAKSHVPGALNFPAKEIYGLLAQIDQRIPKDAEIILYGVDKGDSAPSEVASTLQMMGYGNIKIIENGWKGLNAGGL